MVLKFLLLTTLYSFCKNSLVTDDVMELWDKPSLFILTYNNYNKS